MVTYVRWFEAFCKRLLLKKFFLFLLVIFPVLCIGVRFLDKPDQSLVKVALYCESDSKVAVETMEQLLEYDRAVEFYRTDSLEQLYTDVENTSAECGYVFTGSYQIDDPQDMTPLKRSIQVVESPSSMLTGSVKELVFAAFFKVYSRELLVDLLQKPHTLEQERDVEPAVRDALGYFAQYCEAKQIFEIHDFDEQSTRSSKQEIVAQSNHAQRGIALGILRGLFSVLLLVACFGGCFQLFADEVNSLFLPSGAKRMRYLEIFCPAVLMAGGGLAGFLILPGHAAIWKEAAGLLFYVVAASLYVYVLLGIVRNGTLFRAMVPLLILGVLVFAPVFVDVSDYIRSLRVLKYLFVNSYYLDFMG